MTNFPAAEPVEIHGFRLYTDPENTLGLGPTAEFERETVAALQRLVRPGQRVVDVGANLGFITLHLSRLVGPDGHVLAIEPGRDNLALLAANLAANNCTNVEVLELAVGESAGTARLFLSDLNCGMHRLYASVCCGEASEVVQTARLDDLVVGPVDFIKLDIEGYEPFALAGMPELLAHNPDLRLISEYCPLAILEAGGTPSAMLGMLADAGFHPHSLDGQPIAYSELLTEARRYERLGRDHFVGLTKGRPVGEMVTIIAEQMAQQGCQRLTLENLIFTHQPGALFDESPA